MDLIPTYTTFGLYLVFMVVVGLYFYRKETNIKEYLLGGRGMGSWVTAMSAQASDMSGWLLMGLPGAVYCAGLGESWVAIGLVAGTLANWLLIAPRLRIYTEKARALTISAYLGRRFRDPTGIIRILAAAITLFFFTIYAAAGLVSAGKLFDSMFRIDYRVAVLVGAVVILLYTLMGGYLAVCWTDLFQGLLMFFALIAVPAAAAWNLESGAVAAACEAKNVSFSLIPKGGGMAAVVAIISSAVWGLGYFGVPQVLLRFMAIRKGKELTRSRRIATIWCFISLAAAVYIGLMGRAMFPVHESLNTSSGAENIFIIISQTLFHPAVAGIVMAGILAATISSSDSYLLIASSAFSKNLYEGVFKKGASDKQVMWVSRIILMVIALIGIAIAWDEDSVIFKVVSFAWAGFGATFGPIMLFSLFWKRTTRAGAIAGMLTGGVMVFVWNLLLRPLGGLWDIYELFPAFVLSCIAIVVVSLLTKAPDKAITDEFEKAKVYTEE